MLYKHVFLLSEGLRGVSSPLENGKRKKYLFLRQREPRVKKALQKL